MKPHAVFFPFYPIRLPFKISLILLTPELSFPPYAFTSLVVVSPGTPLRGFWKLSHEQKCMVFPLGHWWAKPSQGTYWRESGSERSNGSPSWRQKVSRGRSRARKEQLLTWPENPLARIQMCIGDLGPTWTPENPGGLGSSQITLIKDNLVFEELLITPHQITSALLNCLQVYSAPHEPAELLTPVRQCGCPGVSQEENTKP